jgi:oligopeptide/dipeptide ABC transporter ATP-binding protein
MMSQRTLSESRLDSRVGGTLLAVEDLFVTFPSSRGLIRAANGISFEVRAGETVGIVGESGSGKSVTLRALIGLVAAPGRIASGSVRFDGRDLSTAKPAVLRAIRGKEIGMIFQDPMGSLNPLLSVGDQLCEVLRLKLRLGRRAARERAAALFERVGLPSARLDAYAHELSGGMAQRVMIAIAIGPQPRLLLADEPTTALDVSVQDQVLTLLDRLRREDNMAVVIVSHDMGVIARTCEQVVVMYAGSVLERGSVDDVLTRARHPYTKMLLATVPSLQPNTSRRRLVAIGGQLPDLATLGSGCPFVPRCPSALPTCATMPIALDASTGQHASACPIV